MIKYLVPVILFFVSTNGNSQLKKKVTNFDVCIYGGTSAGVIAAYTAAKLKKRVILIEPGKRLGGLSSGGLGFTDIGNKYVVTGLSRDFYRRIGQQYGKLEQWTFEPKVAEAIFQKYVSLGAFTVLYQNRLKKVVKKGTVIQAIELESTINNENGPVIKAQQFIDCSYEGDLMASAGVSYTTGREPNIMYNETVNGVQLFNKHQFPDGVDPYIIPGKPESGLLWGISPDHLAESGSGDKKIQSYNFRICLTNNPSNRIDITRPNNYDSTKYELLLRYFLAKPSKDLSGLLKIDMMPHQKTDINNNGPFSTDMIGMNYEYPDGDYATRKKIVTEHANYNKGLLYFIGHDKKMPVEIRNMMLEWGYPKDEYPENDHWTPQLYVREARRMIGAYVMTQVNCQGKESVDDGIGMGAYAMDSHNTQRIVVNGMVKNEGDVQLYGINPYPISYRSITPKIKDCSNLLVPVCLSASHIAYGSIRMEPVFMVLAQSAAIAACQGIDKKISIQNIDIKELQNTLKTNPLVDESMPEILVDNDDVNCITINGKWKKEKTGGYGPSLLLNTDSAKASVKFTPTITTAGNFHIYMYYPKIQKASAVTVVKIFDGTNTIIKKINKNDIIVVGQTSGEWVSLGITDLPAGINTYVEVLNSGADGVVAADAILFIPKKTKL